MDKDFLKYKIFESPTFSNPNEDSRFYWRLKIYTNGEDIDSQTHIIIYLVYESDPLPFLEVD